MSTKDTIQSTRDYDKFSFIESNRVLNKGHVANLETAFEDYGNLTRVQPILVNEKFQIIDGQHRFLACKDMGVPIYFTQIPGLGIAEARSMNILHSSWNMDDYARSYALEGDPNYQKYLRIREDYGFGHSIVLVYALNDQSHGAFAKFRRGEFVLADEKGTRERLNALAEIGMLVPFVNRKEFAMAILKAIKLEGYDQKRMLKKLELHNNLLEERAHVSDYLRLLETIYNFQISEGNRLRFY